MKKIISQTPRADGFHMPAEWERHAACILIWPRRPGSWGVDRAAACAAFASVIRAIAADEKVYLACADAAEGERARQMLADVENLEILLLPADDSWARDIAPTFVVRREAGRTLVRGINWSFNAWGGAVDGLYPDYARDDAFAGAFAEAADYDLYDAAPFVLEGGSIHTDGEGTALVTASCLLSAGRNPALSQSDIEEKLKAYLGVEKVLWLPRGIYNDETNEHVDNACAFIRPGEAVLAWTDAEDDPQYALSAASLAYLQNATDARGRKIRVHKLPVPDFPVRITAAEAAAFAFVPGEDEREVGERLAASYVNFYFTNKKILLPAFGGENAASDARAAQILARLCPEREIVPLPARTILLGGGNIHCITQQIPEGGRR